MLSNGRNPRAFDKKVLGPRSTVFLRTASLGERVVDLAELQREDKQQPYGREFQKAPWFVGHTRQGVSEQVGQYSQSTQQKKRDEGHG